VPTLREIGRALGAEVLSGEAKLDQTVQWAIGGDLMSDVLAAGRPGVLLLTGLTGGQVIRTAEMVEAIGVVFVRGRRPAANERTLELALEASIPVLVTPQPLFDACALVYSLGVRGCQAQRC
jgi:hypothetical protein